MFLNKLNLVNLKVWEKILNKKKSILRKELNLK